MSIEINFLFVYGKLREYYSNFEELDIDSMITMPVITTGKLYEYDGDAVLIEDKNGVVYGTLIIASDMNKLIRNTDSFMGFDENNYENSKFIRTIKDIELENLGEVIKAWCYIYPTSRKNELEKNGIWIKSGDWLEYKKNKTNNNNK